MASSSRPVTTTSQLIIGSSPADCSATEQRSLPRASVWPTAQLPGQAQVCTTIRCATTWSAGRAGNPLATNGLPQGSVLPCFARGLLHQLCGTNATDHLQHGER